MSELSKHDCGGGTCSHGAGIQLRLRGSMPQGPSSFVVIFGIVLPAKTGLAISNGDVIYSLSGIRVKSG